VRWSFWFSVFESSSSSSFQKSTQHTNALEKTPKRHVERREKESRRRRAVLNTLLCAPAVPAALELRRAVVVPEVAGVAHDDSKRKREKENAGFFIFLLQSRER
tara:strand:+ start:599 stop:910 length:312 start_codon:yes stop_codon:yes gene_type:complete